MGGQGMVEGGMNFGVGPAVWSRASSCVTLSESFSLSTPTWSYLQNKDNFIYLARLLSEFEVSRNY